MRVKSIYLENVRGLPTIDLDFLDPVTEQIRPRTVIAGSNGTGKTTILDAVYTLMNLIVSTPEKPLATWLMPGQVRARLELHGMPALYTPRQQQTRPEGWSLVVALGPESWLSQIEAPDLHALTGDTVNHWHYTHRAPANFTAMIWAVEEGRMTAELPTTVYFPSEQREMVAKRKGQIIAEGREYEWVWRFSDSQKWEGSLESFIVALYARERFAQLGTPEDEGKAYPTFQEFLEVVNNFLTRKRIVGVSSTSFRVQVVGEDDQKFSLEELSSGEKQVLLILEEIISEIRVIRGKKAQGYLRSLDLQMHLHYAAFAVTDNRS